MNVSSISSMTNSQTTTTDKTKDLDKNAFFKILSAQLRYQDPMNGGDHTEYTAQLAQFSTLEQLEQLNNNVMTMIKQQQLTFGTSAIGKTASVISEDKVIEGVVQSVGLGGEEPSVVIDGNIYKMEDIISIK